MTEPTRKSRAKRTLHYIGLAANILLAAITIFSAYGGIMNPLKSAVGAIAAMTFPFFLLLTVVITVINAIWFRRSAVVNVISLIICAGPIWTLCPLNLFRPGLEEIRNEKAPTLKIITFNTLNFNTYESNAESNIISESDNPTFKYIMDEDADIVICQESEDLAKDEIHGVSVSRHAMMLSRYPYRDVSKRGMAILSKYPFKKVEVSVTDRNQLDLLRYDVILGVDTLHLFNVHMQSIGLTQQDKELYRHITEGEKTGDIHEIRSSLLNKLAHAFKLRAVQAVDIRKALDSVSGNVMLCGDFNDIPDSYAARTIQGSDMTDAYSHAGLGPTITYHADRLYFRIDHIFYKGNLDALRTWRGSCTSSDHYPLICIFRLTDNK